MRVTRKLRNMLIVGAMALGGLFLSVTPALASGPIVWNHTGGSIPLSWGTKRNTPIKAWMPNSSRFGMWCWTDDDWYYGNYWSNRWFYGVSYPTGQGGWVNASWVYYQSSVPHC